MAVQVQCRKLIRGVPIVLWWFVMNKVELIISISHYTACRVMQQTRKICFAASRKEFD